MAKRKLTLKQIRFLTAYSEVGNITEAARLAPCSRSQHYEWLDDPAYGEAFAEAHEQACERLEAEARRRAVEGVGEPVFYQGAQCGSVQRYSDTLLIFLLKGLKPDKYRDNAKVEHVGSAGGPIRTKVDLSNLNDEQLATLEQLARAAAGPKSDRGGETAESPQPDPAVLPGDGTVAEGAVPEAS